MKIIPGHRLLPTILNNQDHKLYLQTMAELPAKQEFPREMNYSHLHLKYIEA